MLKIYLSEIEKEILYHLSLDARLSLSELGLKMKKSKQVVSYNLNQLERKQVITGYYAVTNVYAIGKTHYRVFLRVQKMSNEKKKEFVQFLNDHPKVVWIAEFGGDLDIAFLVWADTIHEFEAVLDEVNHVYGKYIYKKEFSISTKIEYLSFVYSNNYEERKPKIMGGVIQGHYVLDTLDQHILNHLNKQGRDPYTSIAKELKVSSATIQKRVEKMQEHHVIIAFNYKLNHRLLGMTHRKVRMLLDEHTPEVYEAMGNFLRRQPSVIYIIKVIGEYDFEFEVMSQSDHEFELLMSEFQNAFCDKIRTYATLIHFLEPKSGQMTEF